MPTTQNTANLVQSDLALNAFHCAFTHYKQYLIGRCHHPKDVRIYDPMINEFRTIKVPCGYCQHCKDTKSNQWVQRLYAHSEGYPYVYFTTLSYNGITFDDNHKISPLKSFIMNRLSDAIWHEDDFNIFHTHGYHPCLVVKKHYQDFLKRLRKLIPSESELSYFVCGEYGKRFARPHFHFILFSKTPIDTEKIQTAWSIHYHVNNNGSISKVTRQKDNNFFYPIGRIDHQDMKALGDFDQIKKDIEIDGKKYSAQYCFKYVCKYMLKDVFNNYRLNIAFDSLFPYSYRSDPEKHKDYIIAMNMAHFTHHDSYESFLNMSDSLFSQHHIKINNFNPNTYPYAYKQFIKNFKPFTECSRSYAIGKNFLLSHLKEYQEGNFVKPQFYQGNLNITPQYFLRKVQQSIFSMDQYFKNPNKVPSFKKGNIQALYKHLCNKDFRRFFVNVYSVDSTSAEDLKYPLKSLQHQIYENKFDNTKYLVTNYQDNLVVFHYKFNRSSRKYDFLDSTPLLEFLSVKLDQLKELYSRYYQNQYQVLQEEREKKRLEDILNTLTGKYQLPDDYDQSKLNYSDFSIALTNYLYVQIERDYIDHVERHNIIKDSKSDIYGLSF